MRRFTALFEEIDATNRTNEKVAAVRRYFEEAPPGDAAWALFYLTGNRLPAPVKTRQLREWAGEYSGLPEWMVDLCYARVGDLAETLALLLPPAPKLPAQSISLQELIETIIQPLREQSDREKRSQLFSSWERLSPEGRFVFNKLITGAFRMGVQKTLVIRGLSKAVGMEPAILEHRLMGQWRPQARDFQQLCDPDTQLDDPAQPYPFFLAYPVEERSTSKTGGELKSDLQQLLGDPADWQVEWKYDGIRAQLICRKGKVLLWSRGEEMIAERFPEVVQAGRHLPDSTVLDGELLVWKAGRPRPFFALQRRLGRKSVNASLLEAYPCLFMAYDCLEWKGEDIRQEPLRKRREILEHLFDTVEIPPRAQLIRGKARAQLDFGGLLLEEESPPTEATVDYSLSCAPVLKETSWKAYAEVRETGRKSGVEGLMIKRRDSVYGVGRTRGQWWKWKCDPFTVDAVMIYSQAGHGRRAGLDTDFTFAVWDSQERENLVPVCKAYSGLTDDEFAKINRWIQKNTLERQGPVRMVEPEQVFEIAFEGVNPSSRHKSGFAFRFPRMSRWRKDKKPAEADTLETVQALVASGEGNSA